MFSGSPLFILTLTCLTKDAENVSKMLKARLELKGAAFVYFDIDMSYKRCRKCQQNAQTKIRKGCLRHQLCCRGIKARPDFFRDLNITFKSRGGGGGGGVMPYMCHTETCRRSGYTFWPSNPRQGIFFRA